MIQHSQQTPSSAELYRCGFHLCFRELEHAKMEQIYLSEEMTRKIDKMDYMIQV